MVEGGINAVKSEAGAAGNALIILDIVGECARREAVDIGRRDDGDRAGRRGVARARRVVDIEQNVVIVRGIDLARDRHGDEKLRAGRRAGDAPAGRFGAAGQQQCRHRQEQGPAGDL